eukprot:TRINITY_DN1532_c0_g1_i2.p1 TRINITY_DN1532_c0_g1~~TRINITY_DN1532_c0_g1_i2.p1  ORF type:complete len:594 (-),score=111.54 TRINITY_DN1532_c0_g1_i2:57-1838(-)
MAVMALTRSTIADRTPRFLNRMNTARAASGLKAVLLVLRLRSPSLIETARRTMQRMILMMDVPRFTFCAGCACLRLSAWLIVDRRTEGKRGPTNKLARLRSGGISREFASIFSHVTLAYNHFTQRIMPSSLPVLFCGVLLSCSLVLQCTYALRSSRTSPPMGWNSYDSLLGSGNETEIRDNAQAMAKLLLPLGWDYLVLDAGWYFENASFVATDGHARLVPSKSLFPSSVKPNGAPHSFKPLADYVHSLGLKFGIHVMRGIHKQIVDANEPILGTSYRAKDIAIQSDKCVWWDDFYGINMTHPAGQYYYNSLLSLYGGEWGIDFIKVDCIFGGRDGHTRDIIAVSNAIQLVQQREIWLSLSPGLGVTPAYAAQLQQYADQYRITDDLWDCWGPCYVDGVTVQQAFDTLPNYTSLVGMRGLNGPSWPDADMMPLGIIMEPGHTKQAPTNLTRDEQISLVSLWSIFRNPLIFGGDMRHLAGDSFTLGLLSNPEIISINQQAEHPQALVVNQLGFYVWLSYQPGGGIYVAVFNVRNAQSASYTISFETVTRKQGPLSCQVRDVWARKDLGSYKDTCTANTPSHGAQVFLISGCKTN